MSKIFIVSLPRTGTTSTCLFLLDHGFKVAHTAFSREAIAAADVIADTPVFADYEVLAERYPGSKFLYLERPMDDWIRSITRLLKSMRRQWAKAGHLFEPDIERCFAQAFPGFIQRRQLDEHYLRHCFQAHSAKLRQFISTKSETLFSAQITNENFGSELLTFLDVDPSRVERDFPHVNKGRRVSFWHSIKHTNKIPPHFGIKSNEDECNQSHSP